MVCWFVLEKETGPSRAGGEEKFESRRKRCDGREDATGDVGLREACRVNVVFVEDGQLKGGQSNKRKGSKKTGPVSFSFFALLYAFRLNVTCSRGLLWAESGFRLP